MLYFMQRYRAILRLIGISNEQRNRLLAMTFDFCELAPGEVSADRYEPADTADKTPPQVSAADVAAWEANTWF